MFDTVKSRAMEVRTRAEKVCRDTRLQGMCGPCSLALAVALSHDGLFPEIVQGTYGKPVLGTPHIWVEVNGAIVDVTATQFRYRHKVLVAPCGHKKYFAETKYQKLDGLALRLSPDRRAIFFALAGMKFNLSDLNARPQTLEQP